MANSHLGHVEKNTAANRRLPHTFYLRDTATVARELIGHVLVHVVEGQRVSGVIVETEAYLGLSDRACHSYGDRRTSRTESLYLPGGHAYVYLIYGMHYCFNVVTRAEGVPEAVLVRALVPLEGLESMRMRRASKRPPSGVRRPARPARPPKDTDLTSGPGKLCDALAIDRTCDRLPLDGNRLFIESGDPRLLSELEIATSPRIGIGYAEDAVDWPLRFFVRDNPHVSRFVKSSRRKS